MRRLLLVALVAPLAAGCGSEGAGGQEAASCAAIVDYQGHTYLGHGELRRDPATTGRRVAGTLPGCDDTGAQEPAEPDRTVEVAELAEVPLATAFLWNGSIFVREGRTLPAATGVWFRSPACATDGEFEVVGDWLGVTGPTRPRFDGDLRVPYRLQVHVTDGPDHYLGTTITVRADATTDPVLGPEDVASSLWQGGQVGAVVTCDAGRFHALSLRAPRG